MPWRVVMGKLLQNIHNWTLQLSVYLVVGHVDHGMLSSYVSTIFTMTQFSPS
jgi:hypothetical protein